MVTKAYSFLSNQVLQVFIASVRAKVHCYGVLYCENHRYKENRYTVQYFYIQICFLETKINLAHWLLCSQYIHAICPQTMATSYCMRVKYDVIKDHHTLSHVAYSLIYYFSL